MLGICLTGPLDFCLVIQVLFSPRILNACVRRLAIGLTSHLNNAALPHLVKYKATDAQMPRRVIEPGPFPWERRFSKRHFEQKLMT